MKVAIRDDDTCYFTSPDALASVYHDVWDRVHRLLPMGEGAVIV